MYAAARSAARSAAESTGDSTGESSAQSTAQIAVTEIAATEIAGIGAVRYPTQQHCRYRGPTTANRNITGDTGIA